MSKSLQQAADEIFLSDDAQLEGEQSVTRFVAVDKVMSLQWIDNAKLHDIGLIVQSIVKHGFRDKPSWDANLTNISGGRGAFVEGNGRSEAIYQMYRENKLAASLKKALPYARPKGIKEDVSGAYGEQGLWYIPCEFGLDAESEASAQAYGLDHNSTTLFGGDFDESDTFKVYDKAKLARLARRIQGDDEQAVSFDAESLQRLEEILAQDEPLSKQQKLNKDASDSRARQLPLDMIYTAVTKCTCCLAVQAGLRYGMNSSHWHLCPFHDGLSGRHKIMFIDNLYTDYNHERHRRIVAEYRPKYATVRDIMSREQCREAGIEYFELEQILQWAEELSEFAEHVIVIPKYDCIESIPEKFMLGYSIPTQHGGTFVDVERFKGRRIHLLGGSWGRQLEYLNYFGDDVLSVDNNQLHLKARYGQYVTPEGETHAVGEFAPYVNNVLFVALALSFGNIAYKIAQLYSHRSAVETEQVFDEDAALVVRKATEQDKDAVNAIAKQNGEMLGYVNMGSVKESIEKGLLNVATLDNVVCGFVQYHERKDGIQTIYHIATSKAARRRGVGTALLNSVARPIRLKVTADNADAIAFYERQGMQRVGEDEAGTGRKLYVYEQRDALDFPL